MKHLIDYMIYQCFIRYMIYQCVIDYRLTSKKGRQPTNGGNQEIRQATFKPQMLLDRCQPQQKDAHELQVVRSLSIRWLFDPRYEVSFRAHGRVP
jgi:hypothetical protein